MTQKILGRWVEITVGIAIWAAVLLIIVKAGNI